MKKLLSLLLGACTIFTACTDDVENIRQDGSTKLAVNVKVKPTSRAMVHGTALPGGSSIGINVTDASGNAYDGKDAGYLNVQYTATGEAGAQEWGATTPVLLSGTEGKMHVYYPWTTGIDYKAVAVDVAEQIDWMYAADTYTVSDAKNAHEIILSHAQTAVNVNIVRDASYTGVGAVEALTVTSEGLASTASLDTRDGSFASVTGANTAISIIEVPYILDGTTLSSQENPYMLIPASTETKDFTVSATLDGKSYSHKVTMVEAFAPGKVYKVNVTFKNTGLEVSTVTLVDWDETELGDAEFKPNKPQQTEENYFVATFRVPESYNGEGVLLFYRHENEMFRFDKTQVDNIYVNGNEILEEQWENLIVNNPGIYTVKVVLNENFMNANCLFLSMGLRGDYFTLNNFDGLKVEDIDFLVELDLSHFKTDKVKSMAFTFNMEREYSLTQLNLTGFNTENVEGFVYTFAGLNQIESFDLSAFKTDKLTLTQGMFFNCAKLKEVDLTGWNFEKTLSLQSMFSLCTSLTKVTMTGPLHPEVDTMYMFSNITTTGTFYYDNRYDYSKIIDVLPDTWTAVPLNL